MLLERLLQEEEGGCRRERVGTPGHFGRKRQSDEQNCVRRSVHCNFLAAAGTIILSLPYGCYVSAAGSATGGGRCGGGIFLRNIVRSRCPMYPFDGTHHEKEYSMHGRVLRKYEHHQNHDAKRSVLRLIIRYNTLARLIARRKEHTP